MSNRSGISRMSGATDFDKFEEKKEKTQQQLEHEKQVKLQKEKEKELKNKPDVKF